MTMRGHGRCMQGSPEQSRLEIAMRKIGSPQICLPSLDDEGHDRRGESLLRVKGGEHSGFALDFLLASVPQTCYYA